MTKTPLLLKFVLQSERYVYKDLDELLRSYEVFWKWHDGMWIVLSKHDPQTIAKECKKLMQDDDKLFVAELTHRFSAVNLEQDQSDWLARYVGNT